MLKIKSFVWFRVKISAGLNVKSMPLVSPSSTPVAFCTAKKYYLQSKRSHFSFYPGEVLLSNDLIIQARAFLLIWFNKEDI